MPTREQKALERTRQEEMTRSFANANVSKLRYVAVHACMCMRGRTRAHRGIEAEMFYSRLSEPFRSFERPNTPRQLNATKELLKIRPTTVSNCNPWYRGSWPVGLSAGGLVATAPLQLLCPLSFGLLCNMGICAIWPPVQAAAWSCGLAALVGPWPCGCRWVGK